MLSEQRFDRKLLGATAFATRTLFAGALAPVGILEINQQLLADQQASHTLNLAAAQVPPLPFEPFSISDCRVEVGIRNANFIKNPQIPEENRVTQNGRVLFQSSDPPGSGPEDIVTRLNPNQHFEVLAGGGVVRLITNQEGIAIYTAPNGEGFNSITLRGRSDVNVENFHGIRVTAIHQETGDAKSADLGCQLFQEFRFLTFDPSIEVIPGPTLQPGSPARTPIPVTPPTRNTASINLLSAFPEGRRSATINLYETQARSQQTQTIRERATATPTPRISSNPTQEAEVNRLRAEATIRAELAPVKATVETLSRQQAILLQEMQRPRSDGFFESLGKFRDWVVEHWVVVVPLAVLAAIVLWRRRRP